MSGGVKTVEIRRGAALWVASLCFVLACAGGGGEEPMPVPGFGVLSGQTVLVLPVQYARRVPGGWAGGAEDAQAAARQADAEIAFALGELGGRATWVTPDEQMGALRRRPTIDVDPYLLSADALDGQALKDKRFRDPLYGEIRLLAALFDARYAVWPLEIFYREQPDTAPAGLAVRTFVLDTRKGEILWHGVVDGDDQPPASAGALAIVAQRFAEQVSP